MYQVVVEGGGGGIDLSLESGIFLDKLKVGKVVPLHKRLL